MYDITLAGVQLCKHADVIKSTPLHPNETGYLILFKIIKVSFSFGNLVLVQKFSSVASLVKNQGYFYLPVSFLQMYSIF